MATTEGRRANYDKQKKVLEIVKGMLEGADKRKLELLEGVDKRKLELLEEVDTRKLELLEEERKEIERKFALERVQLEENIENVANELKYFECELREALKEEIERKKETLQGYRTAWRTLTEGKGSFHLIEANLSHQITLLKQEIAYLSQ
jgi:metal-sulfur cluster biosynthetic enzyme